MNKAAVTQEPIHPLLQQRWSPRAFDSGVIADGTVVKILEAARWAPSAFNNQPWRFIVAKRENEVEFGRMVECLLPGNQGWAVNSSVMLIICAAVNRDDEGAVSPMPYYNVGLAVSQMVVEAAANGLFTHQMAGINRPKMVEMYEIPDGFAPVCAMAIGGMGDADSLPEPLSEKEKATRMRKPLGEIAFVGKWGSAATL